MLTSSPFPHLHSRKKLPFYSWGQPYLAWYGLVLTVVINFFNGFSVFLKGNWDTGESSFLPMPPHLSPPFANSLTPDSRLPAPISQLSILLVPHIVANSHIRHFLPPSPALPHPLGRCQIVEKDQDGPTGRHGLCVQRQGDRGERRGVHVSRVEDRETRAKGGRRKATGDGRSAEGLETDRTLGGDNSHGR